MNISATQSLVQFCIAQRNAFDADAWHAQSNIDPKAVGLAAKYLSMTSWYGHEEELAHIAVALQGRAESSLGLYRESQEIGFDLPYFSVRVRIGIQSKFEQKTYPPTTDLGGSALPST